jgi:hypothetical protein
LKHNCISTGDGCTYGEEHREEPNRRRVLGFEDFTITIVPFIHKPYIMKLSDTTVFILKMLPLLFYLSFINHT